ncbi:MAG: DegT/DnrJ/EryC1/StrS family aminotransferase [Ardenticatenaceae bacterium]|nr:DegT/DnrJ/EryC1/StrS family aminotransferase [Ardenticatenaceae bacterium]
MSTRKKDLVEEFWDSDVFALCRVQARQIETRDFLDEFRSFLGARGTIWPARSGSIALQQFLARAIPRKAGCVLLSSFNCRLVADAVLKAGLRIETFDLADTAGRINWESIADQLKPRHRAVVIPHLFGVPTDFRPILGAAEKLGVLVIEDCAHTVGGTIENSMAGTVGDAAIFSFNYDKPISLGGGGLLVVNTPDLSSRIHFDEPVIGVETEERELKAFLAYLHRRRQGTNRSRLLAVTLRRIKNAFTYGIVRRLVKPTVVPWGTKRLFPVSGIGPLRAALGLWQLQRYPDIVRNRNANSTFFTDGTGKSWYVGPRVTPAWLKQKVIPTPLEAGPEISHSLRRQGLPVGPFSWRLTIDRYLGLPEKPNAAVVARHGLDIPIHQNIGSADLELIRRAICGEGV